MQITKTTVESRVKTEQEYQTWYNKLNIGDEVLIQDFIPGSNSFVDFPFERWRYRKGIILTGGVNCVGNFYYLTNKGTFKFYNNFHTFIRRIVPCSSDLDFSNSEVLYTDAPVYEPNYSNNQRVCLLRPFGSKYADASRELQQFDFIYEWGKSSQGDIYYAFADEDNLPKLEHIKILYCVDTNR